MEETINPLEIMKVEIEKESLDFLCHYGVRNFYCNGKAESMSTNEQWNNFVNNDLDKYQEMQHFSNELKRIKDLNLRYLLRTRESIKTIYQFKLMDYAMINSLAVYEYEQKVIRGIYFIPSTKDYNAVNIFVNKLNIFENLSRRIFRIFAEGEYFGKKIEVTSGYKLLKQEENKILFIESLRQKHRKGNYKTLFFGKEYEFTPKEMEIMDALRITGYAKDIAVQLGVSNRTVEWHIDNIKKKSGVSNRLELRDFSNEILKLIKV